MYSVFLSRLTVDDGVVDEDALLWSASRYFKCRAEDVVMRFHLPDIGRTNEEIEVLPQLKVVESIFIQLARLVIQCAETILSTCMKLCKNLDASGIKKHLLCLHTFPYLFE